MKQHQTKEIHQCNGASPEIIVVAKNMWQSHVEIEGYYSIAYFDRITVFEALYC